jgi:NAD(P)-dependent dehydrogenase (short-subunit alcohol dehydrogenase family)
MAARAGNAFGGGQSRPVVPKRVVLVTGASSGIGRETALRLARDGFTVFGGVRRAADGDALAQAAEGSLSPVLLDVTDESSIRSAVGAVSAAVGGGSFSLVNNAGIIVAGPLEVLTDSDLRRQFDVSFFGLLAVTRSLIPLIRDSKGRIVLMGSMLGRISAPFAAPYAAVKAAVGAVAEALSLELRTWHVPVILVEPGKVATPLWGRTKASTIEKLSALPPEKIELYRGPLESFQRLTDSYAATGIPPSRVARVVSRALSARRPRLRYPVGFDSALIGAVAPLLPARLRQWSIARVTLYN